MTSVKALIFDLEGVIVDSEIIWVPADIAFLKQNGVKITNDEYQKRIKPLLMGLSLPDGVTLLQNKYKFKGDLKDLLSQRRKIVLHFYKDISFIPGFEDFYNSLNENYSTAVATSSERIFIKLVDEKLKLSKLFNGNIFSIEDIGFISKPDPAIYLHTAKAISINPKKCVVIEDSPNGILAAKRAGMKCIAITTTTPKEKLNDADLTVDSYTEINLSKL